MIKFRATAGNAPIYGFGLSFANLEKLKDGQPIKIDLSEMGGSGEVWIYAGETEASMTTELEKRGLLPASEAPTAPRPV